MKRRWLIRLSLMVAAPLLFLALLEGVLAAAGVHVPRYAGFEDDGRYWLPCELPGKPPGYERAFPRNYKQVPEEPPLFVRDKPANGWRVFVLGESSVKGLPYEVGCFSDWLRLRATAMLPDRSVEVVNAGMSGWHATDIRTLLQECLEHEPDLLIWMVGHNEFVPHNVVTLRDEVQNPLTYPLREALSGLRTTRWLGRFVPTLRPERTPVFDQLQGDERPCYGPELPLLKQRFRETTAAAVADARAAGVPIILCTMARNVRESPPAYSAFSDGTRQGSEARARWDEAWEAGLAALEAGELETALAALERARAIDDTPAKVHFALGRVHEAAGRPEQAREAYSMALEQDPGPMRAQAWVEQAIRDVARDTGTPLADFQTRFDAASPLGLTGNNLIFDNVHPNLAGHELMATILLEHIERDLAVPFDRSRDVPPQQGRTQLGLSEYGSKITLQAEGLNLTKLALQSGEVNELWHRAHDTCLKALESDAQAWEVVGAVGLLEAIAQRAPKARSMIEQAMARNLYVKTSYIFFWKTEIPYQRAFAAAGVDMAAAEASLTPRERQQLENRLFRAQTR